MTNPRGSGILLHATSLPGPHATGDLGPGARTFVDFLADAGAGVWQLLPVNPAGAGDSPYAGASAFAGDAVMISLEDLVDDHLLEPAELPAPVAADRSDFVQARALREPALRRAYARFVPGAEYEDFERRAAHWLDDYALFEVLRAAYPGVPWPSWPDGLAGRDAAALATARAQRADEVAYVKFQQFTFAKQWARLRTYARDHGVRLIGDIPIFVAHDSADVWSHPELFQLDDAGQPLFVAGVPPDYFSKTGQRWGNPHYRWDVMRAAGFRWWIDRFRTLLERFDVVRLDHFLGFSRYWEIPASAPTAEHGSWQPGPGAALFERARAELGSVPFIAEDLGEITPEVRALRDDFGMPGMRVLQFAFGSDSQAEDFLPHRYPGNTVAYTGTHDNDTFVGWFNSPGGEGYPRSEEQAARERAAATAYLAGPAADELREPPQLAAIRALYASPADTVIIPMQDILGLGNDARMNSPGKTEGNWQWRVDPGALRPELAGALRDLASEYDRVTPVS